MTCTRCGKNEANIHVTLSRNGITEQQHLCYACAQEQNLMLPQGFDIANLLAGFMQDGAVRSGHSQSCPQCGMTLAQFRQGGLLGCSGCYEAFAQQVEPLLHRIHGNAQHAGKVPAHCGPETKVRREIELLQQELRKAIAQEEFERAAGLRDEIREREAKLYGQQDGA